MEKHLPMKLEDVQIENATLMLWIHELIIAGEENNARNWVGCVDKIGRHFPIVREDSFREYVLNKFPIEAILTGLWSESSSNLSLFFSNTFRNYDEEFHIEFIEKYPELAYTLRQMPIVMESMPALNSMLILTS